MPTRSLRRSLWLLMLIAWCTLSAVTAVAQGQSAVDDLVSTTFNGLRYNRTTNTFDTLATITNTSTDATVAAPMSVVIASISDPSVTLANTAGTTTDGHPYINVPLPGGILVSGASVHDVLLKFNNPNQATFTFTTSVRAVVNGPPTETAPSIYITSPVSGTVFGAQPIAVSGTIDDNSARVTVNGVTATVNGGRFIANSVPLPRDGMHVITAIATNTAGKTGQASVSVALSTAPPTVVIDSPPNGISTSEEKVDIAGMVSDLITPSPTVTVNGLPASVNNGHFIAMGIALNVGDNQITAVARNQVGHTSQATITIHRVTQSGLRVSIVSGQAQSGVVGATLPSPLAVRVVDSNGDAVPDQEVTFHVSRGDGTLRGVPPDSRPTDRSLVVRTDANGQAAVAFILGSRTGAGNNRVQASAYTSLSFVEFCASAVSGSPDHINIIPMSNQQTGVVARPLPDPLEAVVSDASGNPVPGVEVTFRVTEGSGSFGGNATTTVKTGPDGIARVLLTLGPDTGTESNVATATYAGQISPPLEFAASAKTPGPVDATTFRGIVLDNENHPLPSTRAVIQDTNREAVTDAEGRFEIKNVPPGSQRLFVDGSNITDSRGRIFPNLEFDVNVISGVENELAMPVYLPPLSTDSKSVRTITGPVTEKVVLELPGVPEATVTLVPGTIVSNANGPASQTNPITVRLSRVNNDRVPMPPPNGSAFVLAGTTQPAGTRFNPPAAVCQPNPGLRPGAQVDIFSFDHDVGQFVSIGLATVSEDGSMICSNPGFGIRKAGWFGATPPPPPTTETKSKCRVVSVTATPPDHVCPNELVVFTATTTEQSPSTPVVWTGNDIVGSPTGNTLTWRFTTPGRKTVTAHCGQSSNSTSVTVGEFSGARWVDRFPNSTSIADLTQPFRANVESFLAALGEAGANVGISATRRPRERAYLMHYSWRIAREALNPHDVPSMAGVDICWVHTDADGNYDPAASQAAAEAMVQGYHIVHRPSLTSRHIEGRAIDMTITWAGDLVIVDGNGDQITITSIPRTGAGNTDLHEVGGTYGVIKLVGDPPHWSDDGH